MFENSAQKKPFENNSKKPLPYLKEIKKKNEKLEKDKKEQLKLENSKNHEKKLIKKIFKERTKSHQPVMRNYLNYLLYKIENPKK